MSLLPTKSQASIFKGVWLVYNDGDNTLRLFGSNTGKERIYLNDKLISERRIFSMKNSYEFIDDKGINYTIDSVCNNLWKGAATVTVRKNSQLVRTFKMFYKHAKINYLARFIALIFGTFLYSMIIVSFKLPSNTAFVFMLAMFVLHFLTRGKDEIIIEET